VPRKLKIQQKQNREYRKYNKKRRGSNHRFARHTHTTQSAHLGGALAEERVGLVDEQKQAFLRRLGPVKDFVDFGDGIAAQWGHVTAWKRKKRGKEKGGVTRKSPLSVVVETPLHLLNFEFSQENNEEHAGKDDCNRHKRLVHSVLTG
jgi:hypothetical protein